MNLGTVLLSHAADPVPFDFSRITAMSEPIVKDEELRINTTLSIVKDVSSREVRLLLK